MYKTLRQAEAKPKKAMFASKQRKACNKNSEMIITVWPEILAGRYFGGLLKICHLAEFTLAVEPVLAIIIFIAKWLIDGFGNLTLL